MPRPVDPDKAIYNGAIPGMLRVLDPHSNFFDPKSYALLREEQSGKYYGVGMQVGPRNNKVIVIAPFAGAPAYRAGIRPGDIIVARRRQADRQPERQRSGRIAERAQRHHGQDLGARARAPTSRSSSPWCAMRFRATASICIS